jgi:excisionase family DNA binding protein
MIENVPCRWFENGFCMCTDGRAYLLDKTKAQPCTGMDECKEYVTIKQAAFELTMSVWTVERIVASGQLKTIQVSGLGSVRLTRAAVDEYKRKLHSNSRERKAS